jgi:DNA-binding response OmpR family regulator
MQKKTRVLIAEDDLQLGFILKDNLEDEGFEVIHCPDGEAAWESFQTNQPDICLLDVNMPARDGFSLTKKIRQRNEVVPIILLTAKSMEEDKLTGFEKGADDYITKPFSMKELLSRMQVFLRRNKMLIPETTRVSKIGGFDFFSDEGRLVKDGEEIILTQKETKLIQLFSQYPNKILKREQILQYVWGKNDYFLGRSMDVFIARLRKLLKSEKNISIETIHHSGYRFNVQEEV